MKWFWCALHVVWLTCVAVGLWKVYCWKYAVRRVYVALRYSSHYFGPAKEVDAWKPTRLSFTDIDEVVGFYLPCPLSYPGRLQAFSAALLATDEGKCGTSEIVATKTFSVPGADRGGGG